MKLKLSEEINGNDSERSCSDDLDDKTRRNSDYDENGNPLDRYLQMRGSPKFGSSSVIHKNHYSASSGFPSNLKDFNKYSISGTPISELESSPFHTTHDSSRTEKKVRKKAKKEEKFILSENIENHVGNKAIDELLDFIENDKNGRKTKKNPQSNDIATLSKSEKNNKKNKDKKLSKPILDEKCEIEHIKEDKNEPKIINEETPLIDKEKTEFPNYKTQTVKNDHIDETCDKTESKLTNSINRMGNTTAKNSSDEKSESQEQINECGVKEKEDITLPSLQGEKMVPETKVNTKSTDNLSESIERQTKKEKKANNKLVDKNIHSNKTKTKGGNSKIDNCIMNGMDSIVSIENNSTKLNTQNGNAKHKHMDKSANKDLSTNDLSLNGITATHNKDATSILKELDLDMVQNEEYRFTDFESLKKEPEFTVVGKKKKKAATAKDVISAKEALIPPKPFRRDERRKGPRSVTPPPSNKLSSNIEGDRTRDLSPSAFPALGSSNQSSFRDARRNSTGDVRMDVQSIIKAQDDSDIESVKSLPASSQGAWGQNSLSPRLPVSYATMAASPKPSGTSLGSSTNDEDTGETNMDLKAANWKGQIKERRHSIGSHPENVKETENSSIKQKYGSQEVLNVCDQEDFPKVGFDSDYIRESNSVKTEKSNTSLNSNVSFIDNPSSNVTNSQLTTSYSKTENSEPAKQMNHDMVNSECSSEKSSESSYKVSNSRRNNNELNGVEKIKSAKQTLSNSKKVKQSVIFMDKRVGQAPQNLGISFFFDSENESGVTNVDCETIQKCSPADLNSNKIPKTSDSNDLRKNSSENITVIENNTVSCNSKENVTDMSRNHILAGKNGVVDRVVNPFVQNKHHPHTEDFIFISDHNQFLDAAPISTDSKLSNSMQQSPVSQPNVNQDNVMLITFGDQLETVSLPKDIQCKIFYRQDSGDASSNQRFNFPEAVRYLNKEWEKALETSRKNPNEVMVYKS